MYQCSKCGLAVIVHEGKVHRGCQCNATVILDLKGEMKGVGGVKQGGDSERKTTD